MKDHNFCNKDRIGNRKSSNLHHFNNIASKNKQGDQPGIHVFIDYEATWAISFGQLRWATYLAANQIKCNLWGKNIHLSFLARESFIAVNATMVWQLFTNVAQRKWPVYHCFKTFTLHALQSLYSVCHSAMIRHSPAWGKTQTTFWVLLSSPPHPESNNLCPGLASWGLILVSLAPLSALCCL